MDLPIRPRDLGRERLEVARMAHLSWKARHKNGGYWREVWYGHRCMRLRWQRCMTAQAHG